MAFFLLGTAAWLIALFTPPLLALWFKQVVAKRHGVIAAHLLLAPCAIASEWASVWLLGFAAHDNGDGPPGLGILLILPFASFFFSVVGIIVAQSLMGRWLSGVARPFRFPPRLCENDLMW